MYLRSCLLIPVHNFNKINGTQPWNLQAVLARVKSIFKYFFHYF